MARRRRGGLRTLAPAGLRAEAEGGLQDDAGRLAFGDLLHRVSIMHTLHCLPDLRQKTKKRITVKISLLRSDWKSFRQTVAILKTITKSQDAPKAHLSVCLFEAAGRKCTQMPPSLTKFKKIRFKTF